MEYIFIKPHWAGNPHKPYVWYSEINGSEITKKELKVNDSFNIKFGDLSIKYCIGSEIGKGEWISCSNNKKNKSSNIKEIYKTNKLFNNYKQCSACSGTNYFDCRARCIGDFCNPSSPLAKEICTPPNTNVYLTSIGGINKVGVSLSLPRRWVEQGSDVAFKIAEAPGLEARRIEQLIAQKYNVKLQIRTGTKIKNLNKVPGKSIDQLTEIITDFNPKMTEIIQEAGGEVFNNPKAIEFKEYYGEIPNSGNITEVIPKEGGEFGGKIIGIKGSILIVDHNGYYFALDLKKMSSKTFKFIKEATMEVQTSLDEWF